MGTGRSPLPRAHSQRGALQRARGQGDGCLFSDYWGRLHLVNKLFHRNYLFSSIPPLPHLHLLSAQASAFTWPSVSARQMPPASISGPGENQKICFKVYFSTLPTPSLLAGRSKGGGLFYHLTPLFLEPLRSVLRPVGRQRTERRRLGAEPQHPSHAWCFLGFTYLSLHLLPRARVSKANERGASLNIPILGKNQKRGVGIDGLSPGWFLPPSLLPSPPPSKIHRLLRGQHSPANAARRVLL